VNRVGGGLTAPVLPHHRAYGSVHGGFFYGFNQVALIKARVRVNTVTTCPSSLTTVPVPPSLSVAWRTLFRVPCWCSLAIEYLRLLLAVEDSALQWLAPLTMASADFSAPLPACPQSGSLVLQTGSEISQGKSCLFRAALAEFTPAVPG